MGAKAVRTFFVVLLAVSIGSAVHSQDRTETQTQPWPGMSAYDVVVCARLCLTAGFVERRIPGSPPQTIWVKDARGWKKDTGWYGIKINGQIEDESTLYVFYRDRMMNLQTLFTYSSVETDPQLQFQDAVP